MPTPRHATSVAQQIRTRAAAADASNNWVSGVVQTADDAAVPPYSVLLTGSAGIVPASSSMNEPFAAGDNVWVTFANGQYVIVGTQ